MSAISPLQQARAAYTPKLPPVLEEFGPFVACCEGDATQSIADQDAIRELFPDTYGLPIITFSGNDQFDAPPIKAGVILSGGQAPGGHNVIAGLYDGLKALNPESELFGFRGGPSGLIEDSYLVLTDDVVDAYRNTGGFDMICSGRTKLETPDQFAKVVANCRSHGITALVIIGGDDSNTNACLLAQYMEEKRTGIKVIGCPKTIDGDLKNDQIEISFGFDTATKVYSELIGNIQRDANSARKYWHFIKLMGRSASHIALECALKTRPNYCIISEEVAAKKQTLAEVVTAMAEVVKLRAEKRMNFGVVLIPEGLIEFIPEIKALISELNEILAEHDAYFKTLTSTDDRLQFVNGHLTAESAKAFGTLPGTIQLQLLNDRDPHGNVQVSKIETEKLLIDLIQDELREWKAEGSYKGKFSTQAHFFGYEGRCAAPSNFDADYCYGLGYTAAALIGAGKTAYMASLRNVAEPASAWIAGGIPLTMMMNMERRHGENRPVIRKALVELDGKPFLQFASQRQEWAEGTHYVYPGPIQYFGPAEVCDQTPLTLQFEQN